MVARTGTFGGRLVGPGRLDGRAPAVSSNEAEAVGVATSGEPGVGQRSSRATHPAELLGVEQPELESLAAVSDANRG